MVDAESSTAVAVECSFCSKNDEDADILIAGENDVYICDECVKDCLDGTFECSFCFRVFRKKRKLAKRHGDANICSECVAICARLVKRA